MTPPLSSRRVSRIRFTLFSALLLSALQCAPAGAATAGDAREPAVAGLFYPKDPAQLGRAIESLLAEARAKPPSPTPGKLRALICPHAGYEYSGPIAARAYALLHEREFDTVIVLGPSHYALLDTAAITGARAFRTPLGDVPISTKARDLAQQRPFAIDPPAEVQRPGWARQSSRALPGPGEEKADTWEHSVEVEIPFLQESLKTFSLIPVVMGDADTDAAARALSNLLDDNTLIVASSDLSHYHSYDEARRLDQKTVDAILRLDVSGMERQEACGRIPILTLLRLAKERGWKPQLLDFRNSGDTSGDKSRVVGYAAIAFYEMPAVAAQSSYSDEERSFLLKLARDTVTAAAEHKKSPAPPESALSPRLAEKRACFVTLTKHGDLRGCIGTLVARDPLYAEVIDKARAAAVEDPRFRPVSAEEVPRLEIEVSVLTPPEPLAFSSPEDLLKKLHPGKDGVVLQIGQNAATYLPQVWGQLPDRIQFLDTLAEKAGCPPKAWRGPDVKVSIYHVESFRDAAPRAAGS